MEQWDNVQQWISATKNVVKHKKSNHFDKSNILEDPIFSFKKFCPLKKRKIFKISEHNTVSVQAAKLLWYLEAISIK
jgi:hypothetical protein